MDTGKNSSSIFGSPAEYKMLVLKISEYPINKELLRRYMQDIAPAGCFVRESSAKGYGARPTEEKALRIADLKRRISEVDRALQKVPKEYRSGVLYHTVHHGCKGIQGGKGCSWSEKTFSFAHPNTWKKWKTRFILEYASIIGEMDHIELLNEYGPTVKQQADIYGNLTPDVIE
jgi:hypothetical protein